MFVYLEKLKKMFLEVTIQKDASRIPIYYHPDFVLFANGQVTNYQEFLSSHQEYFLSAKQYEIEYDEETFLEQGDKLAGSIWITVSVPGQSPNKIELVFIAKYKDGKIFRLWETTSPDWSKLPEFQSS